MAIDKTIDYVIQDGYNNYTKNSKSVTVPKKFKARKNAPATKLAYITEAEAKQLKKQNPGTPHKGPSGIPSYDSFDAQGNYSSGAAMSAAETGGNTDRDRRDMAQAGISPQEAQAIRSAAINAGAGQRVNPGFFDSRTNLTPAEIRAAKKARRDPNNLYGAKSFRNTGQSGIMNLIRSGGLLGSLVRGIGQFFGLGKRPGEATYDMSEFNDLGLLTDRVNPTFQNDLGNELMLSTQKTPERFLPNAGPRQVNIPAGDAVSYVPFSNYGKAAAATGTTVDGVPLEEFVKNAAIAPTPVEQYKDKAYTGIQENVGKPISNFLNNLMNADKIAALENEYGSKYGITDTAGGISSDARHMAAMNELSKSLSPMNNRVGEFIGDTGAFLAGAVNEVPALFRGLGSKNLGEIKEDIIANYKGSFGTPNQTTAEQIYGDVFEGSTPAKTASVPTYGTAAAAEVRPTIGMENTGLGFSIPTGDVGLNASGRLGSLSATVDAIEALKGESVNPELNYSGQFGNTNVYGNYSDDVQNIGLNFNNDKGLSGGISYDAITGEPRFDIGFRRTFADGGLASMFTRRG